jgi:eukaryotic-like serine/threonine-protein kinase
MQGKILYSYTLKHHIGTGGMAEVWYAENNLGKPAAIKIMLPKFVGEQQVVTRFENEAKAMVQLEHKNIRQVYDMGVYEQRPFIIMEYLEGQDLSQFIKQNQKPTESQLELWWQQCTDALNYTHQKNIIHRDIKPSNLFLTQSGEIKILDFGIAKVKQEISITGTGQGLGTLLYMSPQQILDPKRVTNDTDFYSLAVSFVHLMSGRSPYAETESQYKLQTQIVNRDVDMNGVSEKWRGKLSPYLGFEGVEKDNDDTVIEVLSSDEEAGDAGKTVVDLGSSNEQNKVQVDANSIDGKPLKKNGRKRVFLLLACAAALVLLSYLIWPRNQFNQFIMGTWEVEEVDMPEMLAGYSDEEKAMFEHLATFEEAFKTMKMTFKEDGTMSTEVEMMGQKNTENGTWKLTGNGKILSTETAGQTDNMTIEKLSSSKMTLVMDGDGMKMKLMMKKKN